MQSFEKHILHSVAWNLLRYHHSSLRRQLEARLVQASMPADTRTSSPTRALFVDIDSYHQHNMFMLQVLGWWFKYNNACLSSVSPSYDLRGWLGVKNQLSILSSVHNQNALARIRYKLNGRRMKVVLPNFLVSSKLAYEASSAVFVSLIYKPPRLSGLACLASHDYYAALLCELLHYVTFLSHCNALEIRSAFPWESEQP